MSSIHKEYEKLGVKNYYLTKGDVYINPHAKSIEEAVKQIIIPYLYNECRILDMCSGEGLITKILKDNPQVNINILGSDLYLHERYSKETNEKCLNLSFEDISKGYLLNYRFDFIICSFALHLCDKSILENLLYSLAYSTKSLIIISPTKNTKVSDSFFKLDFQKKVLDVYISIFKSIIN